MRKHTKRALEGGGSYAHLLATHSMVLDDHKKEAGKGMCPCQRVCKVHTTPCSILCSN